MMLKHAFLSTDVNLTVCSVRSQTDFLRSAMVCARVVLKVQGWWIPSTLCKNWFKSTLERQSW